MTTMAKIQSTPISLPAAADLTTKIFRFGKFTSTGVNVCSVAGERADGIIGGMYKKTPALGDAADLYIDRVMLVEASGVIAVNDPITTDANGKAKTAGAGETVNAIALDAATADTQYIRCIPAFSKSALAANITDNQTSPGALVVHTFLVPDAATSDIDIVVTDKIEVIDVQCIKRNGAGAGNTMQIKNGATAISDAIACAVDDTSTRAGTIVDGAGTNVIAAGGTLRLTATRAAGTRNALVTVYALKRA
jgi:hypothetical protein